VNNNQSKTTIGKYIYLEWLIPIVDYFKILKIKEVVFDFILPIIISLGVVITYHVNDLLSNAVSKMGDILPNVLAILIGFTISSIAIITSSNDEKLKQIDERMPFHRELGGDAISLYQFILITLIYVLIQEIINLIIVFFVGFISPVINMKLFMDIALGIYVFYILHILAIIVRATVQIYTTNYGKE
jgi:hypothetical protein